MSESRFGLWVTAAVMFFVNGAVYGAWATQIPLVIERLHVSEATFGLMLIATGSGAIIAMSASTYLDRWFGLRRMLNLSAALLLVSFVLLSLLSSVTTVTVFLFIFGAAGGLLDVVTNAYAADVEARIARHVMSSIHGLWSIGGLVGAGCGSCLLLVLNGPAQAMTLTVALGVLFLAFQHRVNFSPGTQEPERRARSKLRGLAIALGLLAALSFAIEGAVRDWSSLYLATDVKVPVSIAGWGFSIFSGVMAIGRFFGDRLRGYLGALWTINLSGLLATAGFLLAVLIPSFVTALLGFALVGFGLSNIVPILISMAGRLPNPAGSIAIVVALGYAGYLATPPIFGFIANQTSLGVMFAVIGGLCLVIVAGWGILQRRLIT